MKQHSHFISLMISDAEYLFIHQLTICMSYTENFQNLHPFLNQIVCGFCFWMLSCMGACFPDGSEGKESACNVWDEGSIPGLGISPGRGSSNPIQYSYLKNLMDRGTWWTTVQRVAESDVTNHAHIHTLSSMNLLYILDSNPLSDRCFRMIYKYFLIPWFIFLFCCFFLLWRNLFDIVQFAYFCFCCLWRKNPKNNYPTNNYNDIMDIQLFKKITAKTNVKETFWCFILELSHFLVLNLNL